MVEGTGLENQRWKHPQVRILSFPPETEEDPEGLVLFLVERMRTVGSTGRRSERISGACSRYSERGGTEGAL